MKIFNVVLASLIFLLAVVSAVFSFFLFEKRSQLVDNYTVLGKQIAKSATDLDKDTKTGVAAKVTVQELSHSNSNKLPEVLKNFDELSRAVAEDRNALAKALFDIAETLECNKFTAEDFMDHSKFAQSVADLEAYVAESKKNHDAALQNIVSIAGSYKISTSVNALKNKQLATVTNKIKAELAKRDKLIAEYQRAAASLVSGTGVTLNPAAPASAFQTFRNKYNAMSTSIATLNKTIKNLEGSIKKKDAEIQDKKREIANRDKTIAELRRKIASLHKEAGVPNHYEAVEAGSRKALDLVRTQNIGKVLVVDEKFGFVTVSLGKKTYVYENLKNGPRPVDPQIPAGAVLIVARNMPSGNAEYVNQVRITKLDDHCSIAEPVDKKGGKPIQVGDMVYFTEKEIEKIIKNRK